MDCSSGRNDNRSLTVEEEAIKQNTDCVYFLASPLTCKKGSECEYRHSEGARLNPRDCRFWLSGNCLNPKCLFRHPPLDGMVLSPKTTSAKIVASSQISSSVQLPMANPFTYNLSRNNVPCHYYVKGACLKGDKCPFMHGPLSVGNPVAKQNAKVSAQFTAQLETPEKDAWKKKDSSNRKNFSSALNVGKESADVLINGVPSSGIGVRAIENANSHLVNKSIAVLVQPTNGLARSQTTYDPVRSSSSYSSSQNLHVQPDGHLLHGGDGGDVFEVPSGVDYTELESPLNHQVQSPGDHYQNGQAAEEVFRDSSPGFDVLVDNVAGDTDYFHERDDFRSGYIQNRRSVNLGDDYDHYYSDYESSGRLDGFPHDVVGEFQHYSKVQNGDKWDQHMTSSAYERILDTPLLTERSSARRRKSPDEMDASDLRHRLTKQRRQDGYFSATSTVRYREPKNTKEKYHAHNSYKDQQSTIRSRLTGRITLPKQLSPEIPLHLQDGRHRGRQPVRPAVYHGSLGQRLGWRPIQGSFANPRYLGRQQKTRDTVDLVDFAGPRSLEELKGAKADRNSQCQSTKYNHSTSSGSLKTARLRDSEASIEFEGPKPLSVLLKRKREAGSDNDAISGINNERKKVVEIKVVRDLEEPRAGTVEENLIPTVDVLVKNAIEDEEEADYTEQKDGEYGYDTVEGGYYKTEEDEMEHTDVDLDVEEDEDDFAKKIGLIFS
ncbi:hypothetical protein KFK09_018704 [Dendrobium nobile]|uniref:C3H1-type domain-containing protein n=1 Tax=Dendrobium nobile TaxID=94219 RepID=A0A8T3AWK4_DENNO|nr:hypothetical protein KFK09_018704 [Dendrobium nobile]